MIGRRTLQLPLDTTSSFQGKKELNYSPSTEDSASPRGHQQIAYSKPSIKKDKEKSQLCKKFIEFGFCPYEKKCKFAHGSHELKKNQQPNCRYKTKECGVFLTEGSCMYGERCNFIHAKPACTCSHQHVRFDAGFQEVKAEGRLQSRLLGLLHIA